MLRSASVSRFRASPLAGVFSGAEGIVSPLQLPGAEAWYDVSDLSSMRNDAGAIPSNGEGVKLISDKSGNSGVNVLCLNGVAGNYASAPDSVPLSITGDIDLRANIAMADWTPSANQYIFGKYSGGGAGNTSYVFYVDTTGNLVFAWSPTGDVTGLITKVSTVAVGATDLTPRWVRVTLDVDNGSTQNEVKFYTSTDSPGTTSPTWTQLGATVTTAGVTSIGDTTKILEIGSIVNGTFNLFVGLIYRAQIRNNILDNGTGIQFDANFATAAKLATSFTESSSNAATVTINTSGATGARISGARDLYQGTAASQPILTIAASGNYLTFDGSNDYLKAAAFSLAQPTTVYFVGSQVTWTLNDYLMDGNAGDRLGIWQRAASPRLSMSAGANGGTTAVGTPALGANSVVTAVFNGASSSIRDNRVAAVTGDASTGAANGFVLGCYGGIAQFANITASEVLVYSTAQNTAQQDALILYLGRHNGIAV